MHQAYADQSMLPWSEETREVRRFRIILLITALIAVAAGVLVPLVELPERSRQQVEELPPQLARVLLEKTVIEQPVEVPVVEEPEVPEVVEEKPEPVPVVTAEPEPAVVPEPQTSSTDVEAAREVARNSGLLALNDQLADMREAMSASSYKTETATVSPAAGSTGESERLVSGATARNTGGSGDIQLTSVTEKVSLGGRDVTRVEEPVVAAEAGSGGGRKASKTVTSRTDEEIRRVFDANKASLYTLYQRALRSNPTLQGTILFELKILPSGAVVDCRIVSSELEDPELERRLEARIKLINFGAKDVPEGTYNYSLGFLPS